MSDANRLVLIAASDDFLLEETLRSAVERAVDSLNEPSVEDLSPDASAEDVAVEVNSPSLFAPERVLIVRDARAWLQTTAPKGAPATPSGGDVSPLVRALEAGAPEGVALVMGAWCGSKAKGPLVDAVKKAGTWQWVASPEPPKPWEEGSVSDAQRAVLRPIMERAAPGTRFSPAAERLLLERLGFAPRRLAQESAKLAAAAGNGSVVDETLVRRMVLQRDGSLEELQDAILQRNAKEAAAFLDKARRNIPVTDWSGQRLSDRDLAFRLFNLSADCWTRMLYLRQVAAAIGAEAELEPRRNTQRSWYSQTFKTRLAPALLRAIAADPGSPFGGSKRAPKPWSLHLLFKGAGRYRDTELTDTLIAAASVEKKLRRPGEAIDALPAWILGTLVNNHSS